VRSHAHVDFRAIPSKTELHHAGGHKINSPTDVLSHVLRYWHSLESNPSPSSRIRIDRELSGSQCNLT